MFAPERLKSSRPPRRLDAQELTLGANLRVLSDTDNGNTAVIAASSVSGAVPSLPVLHGSSQPVTQVTLPLLATQEVASALQWYRCDSRALRGSTCMLELTHRIMLMQRVVKLCPTMTHIHWNCDAT